MPKSLTLIAALAFSSFAAGVSAADRVEPKTEAAVRAADDDWLVAERRGDTAALDARLAPGYRDVLPDGTVHTKDRMLYAVAHLKTKSTEPPAKIVADVRTKHPSIEQVMIAGDTAVLSFHSVDPAKQALVKAVDVFTYDHGVWRAVLSVHTGASAPSP